VHQRGAVHQLKGDRCGIGQRGCVVAAGSGDCQTQLRANPSAAIEDRMVHRIFKARRGADACGLFEIDLQCGFCAVVKAHMPP